MPDPFATTRLVLRANAKRLTGEEKAFARRRYISANPGAAEYIDFGDFSIWRAEIQSARFVKGFAQAFDLGASDLLTEFDHWRAWRRIEPGAVAHMNEDHSDATRRYATHYCGACDGPWRIIGLDPEGVDMALDDERIRLTYDQPLAKAEDLRPRLVALAKES